MGALSDLCLSCRGVLEDITHFSTYDLSQRHHACFVSYRVVYSCDRMLLRFKLPLVEIVTNFYDAVKSISSGYASLGILFMNTLSGVTQHST